jgi:Tfp pilus assembly protein PilO
VNSSKTWVLIGAALAVVVLAGGYFLGVAPALADAKVSSDMSASVQAQNARQAEVLAELREQAKSIDVATEELKTLQESLPPEARLSNLVTQVSEFAVETGVAVTSITAGDAILFVHTAAAPPTSSVTPVQDTGLVAIPITVTVSGTSAAIFDFIEKLRTGPRLFLVHDLSMAPLTDGSGTNFEASIVGLVYALPSAVVSADQETNQ